MKPFIFSTCNQIICEAGASARLGEICKKHAAKKVLLVTDPEIEQLGLHCAAFDNLSKHDIDISVFSKVQADPPESVVLKAVEQAKVSKADTIIGFGGGSSMDVAKLVALLAHPECTQSLEDIYGLGNASGQRLSLIQVPTTAGTGSEVTQVAIVTTGETTKIGAVTPLFLPDIALLDCELTLGLPAQVTAATGIDAIVHAIEAYTSHINKNPMSDLMAKEALRLLTGNILSVVQNGKDKSAREAMLFGAMLAGQAFANAPVAAIHALAYPLGGHFHIPHGLSNSLMLPHVMRFNLDCAAAMYAELAPFMFPKHSFSGTEEEISLKLIKLIENLIAQLELPSTLREMNIPESKLNALAEDAMLQTRLLINNPKEVTLASAKAIYQAAY